MTKTSSVLEASPLTICLQVKAGDDFYPEAEVADRLTEILKHYKNNAEHLDGSISIIYCGNDLLGVEFWEELDQVFLSVEDLLQNEEATTYLPLSGCWLTLSPQGEGLIYTLRSNKRRAVPVSIRQWIPKEPFIREWILMQCRVTKILAALGDESASLYLPQYEAEYPPEVIAIVGKERLRAIAEGDLEQVLSSGRC